MSFMVRFYIGTLYFFGFTLNFLNSLLATHYLACSFFLLGVLRRVNRVLAFSQILSFDPGSLIKLLQTQIEKVFFWVRCDFTLAGLAITCAELNRTISTAAPASPCKHLSKQQRKLLVNRDYIAPWWSYYWLCFTYWWSSWSVNQDWWYSQRKNDVTNYYSYFWRSVRRGGETQLTITVAPKWCSFRQLKRWGI